MSFRIEIPKKFMAPKVVSVAMSDLLENHKSTWEPNSKGGEPNHRPEQPVALL
jgi:hypothetical protein